MSSVCLSFGGFVFSGILGFCYNCLEYVNVG